MKRSATALALFLALVGCKEKQQAPTPATSGPAQPNTGPRPSLPEQAQPGAPAATSPATSEGSGSARPTKPISVNEAEAALPALTGPTIIALKQTSDQQQVHGTWCLDGTSAEDVAKQVGSLLAQAKYTNLSIRGDAKKAGVMGDREGLRFSMVVSASSASVCAAPAHYFASATIFRL